MIDEIINIQSNKFSFLKQTEYHVIFSIINEDYSVIELTKVISDITLSVNKWVQFTFDDISIFDGMTALGKLIFGHDYHYDVNEFPKWESRLREYASHCTIENYPCLTADAQTLKMDHLIDINGGVAKTIEKNNALQIFLHCSGIPKPKQISFSIPEWEQYCKEIIENPSDYHYLDLSNLIFTALPVPKIISFAPCLQEVKLINLSNNALGKMLSKRWIALCDALSRAEKLEYLILTHNLIDSISDKSWKYFCEKISSLKKLILIVNEISDKQVEIFNQCREKALKQSFIYEKRGLTNLCALFFAKNFNKIPCNINKSTVGGRLVPVNICEEIKEYENYKPTLVFLKK